MTGLLSFRRMWRDRGLILISILVFAVGIGVNLAFLNAAYAMLWRPLQFPDSQLLQSLSGESRDKSVSHAIGITGSQAEAIRQSVHATQSIGLITPAPHTILLSGSEQVDLAAARADSGYFHTLLIRPAAGALFTDAEDQASSEDTPALLTYSAWVKYFRRDPGIFERVLFSPEGETRRRVRIEGILPNRTTLPFAADAELILSLPSRNPSVTSNNGDALYTCVIRLRGSASQAQLSNEIQNAFRQLDPTSTVLYRVEKLREALAPPDKRTILFLIAAAALLLALTCANLATLFLTRTVRRAREHAIRLALGASRRHLLLLHLADVCWTALAGTVLALSVNLIAGPALVWLFPEIRTAGAELLRVGPGLITAGFFLALISGACVAMPAAWLSLRADLRTILSSVDATGMQRPGRWPLWLLSIQTAIVVVLLATGGLVVNSFVESLKTDPGFESQHVMMFRATVPAQHKAVTGTAILILHQLRQIPGTANASFAAEPPVGGSLATVMNAGGSFSANDPTIPFRMVGPQYFETLHATIQSGRSFTEDDVAQSRSVLVLNQAAAQLLFGAGVPVGRTVHGGFLDFHSVVIGVIKDIRHEALDKPAAPMAYMPYLPVFPGSISFVVRSSSTPRMLYPYLRSRLAAEQPPLYPRNFVTLESVLDDTVHRRFVASTLVGVFASFGLFVASLGLYGVLSNDVMRRKREIAIRMCAGARVRSLIWMLVWRSVLVVLGGGMTGAVISVLLGFEIRSILYGVDILSPRTEVLVFALLLCASSLSCIFPILRIARVAPAQTLREQ